MENRTQSPEVAPAMTQEDFHTSKDNYNLHDASFRRHYQLNYANSEHEYDAFYAPAYRYGFELGEESAGTDWSKVEQDAKEYWASSSSIPWGEVADAVHYGWVEERDPERLRVHHEEQMNDLQPAFLEHYNTRFQDSGENFENYVPLYNYGYNLAIDPANHLSPWTSVEPDVRALWESEYHSRFMWEDYRDAVQHAWEEVHNRAKSSS
ncbi:MAG: hypothetical protein U0175_34280 [Caldilineaceae bacterium]